MSWDINHVILVGRLTRDPELTYTQSGAAICKFSIAVNRSSGSGGDTGDTASFFNIVAWNKTAEICKEYLTKGKQVGIDGRLQQRRWTGSDDTKRSTVEIVANNVQFFGPARQPAEQLQTSTNGFSPEKTSGSSTEKTSFDQPVEKEKEPERDPFLSELGDDEIPF